MSVSTFVRWTCNHCAAIVDTSTRSRPDRGIIFEQGQYESSLGPQMLPDIWLCAECTPDFAGFLNLSINLVGVSQLT